MQRLARILAAVGIAGFPAFARFTELASTADGRQLYFSSTQIFAGTPTAFANSRVYRITESNAIQLFSDEEGDRFPPVPMTAR